MHHSDVIDQYGSIARHAQSTGYEPNLFLPKDDTNKLSIADGDDEDLMCVENYQLGQAPSSLV